MTKQGKKLTALMMAGVLACSPATAFAANKTVSGTAISTDAQGSSTSTGTMINNMDEDYIEVELPVSQNGLYDFVMDPQELIVREAQQTPDGSKTFYFKSTGNAESDELEVTSKSNVPIDVTVSAELSSLGAITVTPDKATGTSISMYLGVMVENSSPAAISEVKDGKGKVEVVETLAAVDEDNFEVVSRGGIYTKTLKSGVANTEFQTTKFKLEGYCNGSADWTSVEDVTPQLDVVWKLEKHETAPKALTVTKSGNNAITVKTFDEVKSAKLVKYNGAANTNSLTIGTNCSVDGKNFTLLSSWASKITGETVITLTFADGQTQTLTVKVQ